MKLGLKKLRPILAQCDVTSLNVEETMFLFNTKNRDIRRLLILLKKTGTDIALITDGPDGSYAYDGKEFYYC